MQSGIKASAELKAAFSELLSSPSQFALFATIESESLVPGETVASSAGFPADLSSLTHKLQPNRATYLIVRTSPSGQHDQQQSTTGEEAGNLLCITYTPDAAPVRQKMLIASTRLTLSRELGTEHFCEHLFCTEAEEVSEQGWARHQSHSRLAAPLTAEEREAEVLREHEARGGLAGTGRREGHYVSSAAADEGKHGGGTGGGGGADVPLPAGPGVLEALEGLKGARPGALVLLRLSIGGAEGERLEVDSTIEGGVAAAELGGKLHATDPRYCFYTLEAGGGGENVRTVFIYTCPTGSKVKERMVYASSRNMVVRLAEAKVGLKLDKKLEGSGPDDFTEDVLVGEFAAPKVEEKKAFARPKRPGRR